MKLNNTYKVNGQEMDIWVEYDQDTDTVEEILNISFTGCGQTVDASDIMIRFFEPALNKLIDDTNWSEIFWSGVLTTETEN